MERPDIAILDERVRSIYRDLDHLVKYTIHIEERLGATLRALTKISNNLYGIEPNAISPQQIAQDAILAHGRACK